jgi:oxygen-dependent protoporphyrinogen oxidase
MRRIAIIGGGIAGLTAAYELARLARAGAPVEAVLFESSSRLGGLVETVREGGFTVECGPDAWVSAKPWARELAIELGLESELIHSNDATRKTWLYLNNRLLPLPDGLNMFVPTTPAALAAIETSPLFTPAAIAAYRSEPSRAAELISAIPAHDESIASFTLRHFGPEVLAHVAAPLLAGVFGGDVHSLSARAVLPALVAMERTHGSLIAALAERTTDNGERTTPIFTTLRSGLGTLIDRLTAAIPQPWLRLNTTVTSLQPSPQPIAHSSQPDNEKPPSHTAHPRWTLTTTSTHKRRTTESFDAVLLATPLDAARALLTPLLPEAPHLLPTESSSAVLVAFCFPDAARVPLPPGFGLLVPPKSSTENDPGGPSFAHFAKGGLSVAEANDRPSPEQPTTSNQQPATSPTLLLACTFTHQKFPHRVPPGARQLRAFFGGAAADRLARCNNDEIAAIARLELARILNHSNARHPGRTLSDPELAEGESKPEWQAPRILSSLEPDSTPAPPPVLTVIRRWPRSLPQYAVGHLDRAAELESRIATQLPGLTLLGNALHGVGLPDLIHAARMAARKAARTSPRS